MLPQGSLRARFARGAIWSLVGTVGGRFFALLSGVVVARLLGKEGYGELGIVLSTALMFQTFGAFGLGLTATKHVAELRATNPEKASRIMALSQIVAVATGALCAVAMYLLSPWLAREILAAPHLVDLLRISGIILFFGSLSGAQGGALAGLEAFQSVAAITLLSGLVTVPLTVCGVLWFGLEGAVWAAIAVSALTCILNHGALRRHVLRHRLSMRLTGCWREGRVLWRFSLPALLAGVMVAPVNWACAAMLVNQPGGYGENGVYNAANQWFAAVLLLPGIATQVLLPILSERLGAGAPDQTRRLLRTTLLASAVLVAPVVLCGSLASPWIMRLYGPDFADAWPTLIVVLLTAGLLAVMGPAETLIAASGRMWLGFWMNTGWAGAFMVAGSHLAPFGSLGLASARLIAYALHGGWVWSYLLRANASVKPQTLHAETLT